MRTKVLVALVASLLLGSFATPEAKSQQPGQSPSANAARFGIGVVDISYIFENHLRFKAMMDQMKEDVKATEEELRKEREQIGLQDEKLKQFTPGSPDYKRFEEQQAEVKARFNLKAAKQRKDFLEREAKIYYQTYLEVNDAIKLYAQSKGLGLVLRFNGDPIDANKREDVLRAINKPVVYQGGIDITPDILAGVNRTPGGTQRPVTGGTARPTIPGRTPVQR
ncbi:MAG: OmpH family outer membrane protein [Planctomycetales bacterium]|nr:OmpH family outer membrane protein [Planctomycetales bacterium]